MDDDVDHGLPSVKNAVLWRDCLWTRTQPLLLNPVGGERRKQDKGEKGEKIHQNHTQSCAAHSQPLLCAPSSTWRCSPPLRLHRRW